MHINHWWHLIVNMFQAKVSATEEKLALSQSELQQVKASVKQYESLLDSYKIQVWEVAWETDRDTDRDKQIDTDRDRQRTDRHTVRPFYWSFSYLNMYLPGYFVTALYLSVCF